MSVEIKYIPLTFINTDEEILKQIKNTVLFSYLFQNFEETSLLHYLQSTQYGYTASSSVSGRHQLVRITDINSGNVDWNTVPFCDCTTEEKYLLKDDDILVARTGGTTGKSFIVNDAPKNAVFASYLIRLRLKEDVNIEFINIYLNSYAYWSQIIEMKSGSAMPNVNAEKLKTLGIPKISFKEQNEFVTAFNNGEKSKSFNFLFQKIKDLENLYIDSKENTNELTHQLDLVKQLRQSFLREAMQGKLVKSTNTRETGQQLLEKIKAEKAQLIADKKLKEEKPLAPITEEEIPFEIPEHWIWCRLGIIAEIKRGKSPKYSEKGVFKMLNQKCVRWYFVDTEHSKAIDEAWYNTVNIDLKINTNDLLINSTGDGTIGRSAIADISCQDFMYDSHILRVRSLMQINQQLLCYIINSVYGQSLIESIKGATSTKQTELGVNNLSNFPIPLPPLHEQEQIVAKLEELMAFCDGLEQSIKESQGYNEMLLQQVLRQALQPKEEMKIIPLQTRKLPNPLKTVLSAHIVNTCNTRDFGRVKFQKLLFLVEYFCKIDFESKYVKKTAGPYDSQLITQIEQDFKRLNFFKIEQENSETHRVRYTAKANASEINGMFLENFPDESLRVNNLLMKLRPLSWSECEIVATIFAVWNNRIIKKELVSDEMLFADFMAWSSRKSNFDKDFYKKLFWMKEQSIIPEGWGNYVDEPGL